MLLFSHPVVSDSVTPWAAARQVSLSFTISQSLLKLMFIALDLGLKAEKRLNSCSLSWWCHPTTSSSVICFCSCLMSFPTSGSFPISQLFASGGQSIRASVSASVLPVNIQGWFPLGWTGLISLLYEGLSRAFSSTTVQKHQFFGAQPQVLITVEKKWLFL